MIIVSGRIYVDPNGRAGYLTECAVLIEQARRTAGCLDFHLSADPLEEGRINVYEQWESADAVEEFRGSGPTAEQATAILDARVFQHEIASTRQL